MSLTLIVTPNATGEFRSILLCIGRWVLAGEGDIRCRVIQDVKPDVRLR